MSFAPDRITLCGSLSRHPVSLGAVMHNAGYRALGLSFQYVPFAVTDLEGAIRGMRALGMRGLGISMPFKVEVMALLDAVDARAAEIGAVNTVVNEGGRLTGYNTDADGALRALGEVTPLAGKRVLLLGAGGAARAVGFALTGAGVHLEIANRSADKADALASRLGVIARPWKDAQRAACDFDVVVNASSATMVEYGGESPIAEDVLQKGQVVMDIVYKPVHTALLAAADRRGARTVHGGVMLLYQACRQFELYTARDAPVEVMRDALLGIIDPPPVVR